MIYGDDLSQLAPLARSILGAFSDDLLGSHVDDLSQLAPLATSILGSFSGDLLGSHGEDLARSVAAS